MPPPAFTVTSVPDHLPPILFFLMLSPRAKRAQSHCVSQARSYKPAMSPEFQSRFTVLEDDFAIAHLVADADPSLRELGPLGHIRDLGRRLPELPEAEKTDVNLVRGCISKAWLVVEPSLDGIMHFHGNAEAETTRGLIAILMQLLNGLPFSDIREFDVRDTWAKLHITEGLSSRRTGGVLAMVDRLKAAVA